MAQNLKYGLTLQFVEKIEKAGFWGDFDWQLSGSLPMLSGTPQGATLSPLYFAIFIAYIVSSIKEEHGNEGEGGKLTEEE